MKYQGCLLAVKDMATSKNFYENVLAQKVVMDLGVHVSFEGFSLQQGFDEVIGISANSVKSKEHNFQLYFELDDLDAVFEKMKSIPELQWVHEIKEYAWDQRDFRVYDPDFHSIEIAESMESVVKRFLRQGMSVEEVSKKTMYPLDMLKQLIN